MTAGHNYDLFSSLFTDNAFITLETTSAGAYWVQVCLDFSIFIGILDNPSASAFFIFRSVFYCEPEIC